MRLMTLTLENFQGIKSLTIDLNGKSASIYGDNATGKTTVYNAFTWLLFGRASTGAKNFTPKTRSADGEAHNLNHAALAVIEDDAGKTVSLRKVYKEVYKRQRGSASDEFTGHTIDYYVNEVPVKEKDYAQTIESMLGDPEQAKVLTMPDYFAETIRWEDRRKILLELCGNVDDQTIIATNPELTDLPKILAGKTIADYLAVADSQKKMINRDLQEIPSRIDELKKTAEQTAVTETEAELQATIKMLDEERRVLSARRSDIMTGGARESEIRSTIANIKAERLERLTEYRKKQNEQTDAWKDKIRAAEDRLYQAQNAVREIESEIKTKTVEKEMREEKRKAIIEDIVKARSEEWNAGAAICPTCGQMLPEDRVEQMRSEFNARKSKRLEELNALGKQFASRESIANLEVEISSLMTSHEQKRAEVTAIQENLVKLKAETPEEMPSFDMTEESHAFLVRIEEAQKLLAEVDGNKTALTDEIDIRIKEIGDEIFAAHGKIAAICNKSYAENRISELCAKEKDLAAQYEELERGVWLCGLFIKAKVRLLDEQINARFKTVRFRLFKEQINGGIADDCEVLIPSPDGNMIPYAIANNAAKINAGVEIIDTLGAYYGKTMPLFIDNAESVTHLVPTTTQVIRLIVSEEDKKLRIVIAD